MNTEIQQSSGPEASSSTTESATMVKADRSIEVNNAEPPPRSERLQYVSIFADLAKALAWPMIAITLVSLFIVPIRKTLDLVPLKIDAASKASVGSLSWEIERQARRQGGNDLAQRVGNLSPTAIEELINTQRDSAFQLVSDEPPRYTLPNNNRLAALKELRDANLISFAEPLETFLDFVTTLPLADLPSANPKRRVLRASRSLTDGELTRLRGQTYELTPSGTHAIDAIIHALLEQLQPRV